jgi:hypothetical protein
MGIVDIKKTSTVRCQIMRNRCFVFLVAMGVNVVCLAQSLWSEQNGFTLGPIGAQYNINAGITSGTSTQTDYAFHTDTSCGGTGLTFGTFVGSYTFYNPSLVQANGVSLYNKAVSQSGTHYANSVQSIQLAPAYINTVHLFVGTSACIQVTVSGGAFVRTGGAVATTLQSS